MKRLTILKRDNTANINIQSIPDFVIKQMKSSIPTYTDDDLNRIEPLLIDSLFPFQREGVLYGISRGGRFLLGDDMGLGKTRQALAVADYYKDEWPLLIVTTAATRDMWNDNIFELLPNVNTQDVVVVKSQKEMISEAKVVICSYSSMDNSMKKFELKKFGVIIFDESHSIKNSTSKQTINATLLGEKAKQVILITGTPALSRPSELYAQLAIINKRFSDYFNFTKRYCDGKSGRFGNWEATGATHLDELKILLQKKFMIRRTKQDVCMELGDKKREVVEMKDFKLAKKDAKHMENFNNDYLNADGKKRAQNEILLNWYSDTAKIKAPAVCQYLRNVLTNSNEKFLIFAHHQCLMNEISSCLGSMKIKFIRIDGQTKADTRNSLVSRFQNDPDIKCAILSIRACNAGITLTAASNVIFAELDWTPAIILQAEGRAHRIGQEKQVHSTFLIAPGTADEVIWRKLQWKQKSLDKIGLIAQNEHLSQHERRIVEPGPSTSRRSIADYFEKKESPVVVKENLDTEENSIDQFFTCEEVQNILDNTEEDTTRVLEEKFMTGNEIDSQTDIDFDEIEAIEKQTSKPVDKIVDELLDGIEIDDDF